MRYTEALKEADRLGRQHGGNAADWYWDRTSPDREDFLKVLKGIRDGDPEIMDTFVPGNLSGEWASDMTPNRLYEEIGLSKMNLRNWELDGELDEICTAYTDAFNSAYQDAIEESCREGLERQLTFVIDVTTRSENPQAILGKLTDLLVKEGCQIDSDRVCDEIGEEIRV